MKELSRTIPRDNHSYHLSMSEIFEHIADCHRNGYDAVITVAPDNEKTRTNQQRKAIEIYCGLLAKACCDQGLSMKVVIDLMFKNLELMPTKDGIKENILRPIMIRLFNKKSTTSLLTNEVSILHEALSMAIVQRMPTVTPPEFPSVKAPPLSAYDEVKQ